MKFELEVLLVGEDQHMFMYFKLSDSIWILYDNTRGIPFRYFDLKMLYNNRGVCICAAIYVNTTQAEDYKHGIPETSTGTKCFNISRHQRVLSNHMDARPGNHMQDLGTILQTLSLTSS